jgi:3'-phosphoadenosine 5'-phosphosulfate (PAPS) 3'-phosphatase
MLASPASMEEMFEFIDLGGSGTAGRKGRVWVMDSIDGTETFFARTTDAVALALVDDGEEKVGVLGYPNLSLGTGRVGEKSVDERGLGLMLSAVKSEGAVMRPIETDLSRQRTRLKGRRIRRWKIFILLIVPLASH